MTDELKPCPFCGGAGKQWTDTSGDYDYSYVECIECHASTDYVGTEAEAIAAWNRRTGENNATE